MKFKITAICSTISGMFTYMPTVNTKKNVGIPKCIDYRKGDGVTNNSFVSKRFGLRASTEIASGPRSERLLNTLVLLMSRREVVLGELFQLFSQGL